MIEILNRQRRRKIHSPKWRTFAEQALQATGAAERDLTIVFLSDPAIRKLNRRFRGRDYATDVLSFASDAEVFEEENQASLGEIVISVDRAIAQAQANQLSFENELKQLVLHGVLHLCGYDHETDDGEMNRLERRIRKQLQI
jgi:rRNA maturation RNase YbeY